MKKIYGKYSKDIMRLFYSDIGSAEFFSYVGNIVSLEKAIATIAILSPDFIERDNCIFWRDNADDYDPIKNDMVGFKRVEENKNTISKDKIDIERFYNNFTISQFFHSWEDLPGRSVFAVNLSEEDKKLCFIFAEQIKYYWTIALKEAFPTRSFEFEIGEDILDEYGVCLTFWQTEESRARGILEADEEQK